MNTFDRYLLREWLRILGLVLAVTMGLLLVQVMFDDFRQLHDLGAGALDLAFYFLVTLPSFLGLVLPLALLVSLLFVLGKMHRTNQLNAMRTAGVGFLRMTRSIWLVGAVCCWIALGLNSTIVPWSVVESRSLKENLQNRALTGTTPVDQIGRLGDVTFNNFPFGRMWWFNRFSTYNNHGYGVNVHLLDHSRRETARILAREAFPAKEGGWRFLSGQELTFDAASGELTRVLPFDEKVFPGFNEDPTLLVLLDGSRRPVDLSFHELRRAIDYYEADDNPKVVPYAVRYYGLLADALTPLIVIAIAIPFAVSGVRANPAVGVSKAIGLYFVYYILTTLANLMALKQVMPPEIAAWLPNLSMAVLAAWFFARLR